MLRSKNKYLWVVALCALLTALVYLLVRAGGVHIKRPPRHHYDQTRFTRLVRPYNEPQDTDNSGPPKAGFIFLNPNNSIRI